MKILSIKGYDFLIEDSDYERVIAAGPWFLLIKYRSDGSVRRVSARRNIKVGKKHNGQQYLSQFILNTKGKKQAVHMDNDSLNCLRSNLVAATHSQALAKQRKRITTISGFKGVSKDRYGCSVFIDGKYLGHTRTAEDGARIYDPAATAKYGRFAVLNFPQESL